MYAKLIEGKLYYATDEDLTDYKIVIDEPPVFDSETQYLTIENYIENEDSITIDYEINDKLINPTIEERLKSVEDVILNLL